MAYSMDYRLRAVEYKDEGHTFKELRETFKIPAISYYAWKRKQENRKAGIMRKSTRLNRRAR